MSKPDLARGCDEVHLTMREIEVLRLAAAGLADRRIAGVLRISLRTVESHLARMMEWTGAKNRTELVARGYAAGILVPSEWPPAWPGSRRGGIQVPCGRPLTPGARRASAASAQTDAPVESVAAAQQRTLRTSSYIIYVDVPHNDQDLLLVHGYTGTFDKVSKRVGTFVRTLEGGRAPKALRGDRRPDRESVPRGSSKSV